MTTYSKSFEINLVSEISLTVKNDDNLFYAQSLLYYYLLSRSENPSPIPLSLLSFPPSQTDFLIEIVMEVEIEMCHCRSDNLLSHRIKTKIT